MEINFTPQQQQVINLHGRNILVSAAAGSGKTAVLVERIIQMICRVDKPIDIDKLLVVTFTNAAAAEMRERISIAITKRLEQEPENEHLQKQATLLHNAQITTIDSFCLFILRNNFNSIGLDPTFRVADEGEIVLLKQKVLAELLEDRFASKDEDFYHCVEVYCPNGKEATLEKHILELYNFAMSYPWPEEWLEERKADYASKNIEQIEETDWAIYLKKHITLLLEGCVQKMQQVINLCEQPDGPYMYGELAEGEMEQLERLCKLNTLIDMEGAITGVSFARLPAKKDESVAVEKREMAKNLRNQVKGCLQDIQEHFFATPLILAAKQMENCEVAVSVLVDLCLEFKERLDKTKREKNLLDFSDMEHFALNILINKTAEGAMPTDTAMEYREYFEEVLTDEYQDSNLVQEYILKAVSGDEIGKYNRFMVGDVKQSIYKFRLARPELFLEKYHTYTQEDSLYQRIDLHNNFRSRQEVIQTVNEIFERIMCKQLGGIEYDESAALYPGAVYPENSGCESELILMQKPDKEEELSAKQMEAFGIAKRIKELRLTYQVTDKVTGELRPASYKDMVVLLRTNSGWDDVFKKVLEEEGIPTYISSRTGYFAAGEIQQVMQFLRVLDNPLQDIPMFGVMHSIFGGFTDEEVAQIKCRQKNKFLYENIKDYAGEEDALAKKCQVFLVQIEKYRKYTAYMSIRSLLKTLIEEYGYLYYVAALPAGEQRLANVEMLLERAGAYEKTSYYGLFHFIRYMEQLEKYNVDYGEASILDETADVVRIMSIHKSKGLEFPITFVAGLAKRFNMQDANQAMIIDVDMGIGTDYVDPKRRLKNKTLRKNVISAKMKADNLAEELRVLYVALTRAKEKLIMTGVINNAEEKCKQFKLERESLSDPHAGLPYGSLIESSSYLDFILPTFVPTYVWGMEELTMAGIREGIGEAARKNNLVHSKNYVDSSIKEELQEKFNYEYAHKNLANLYTKTTVSELKLAAIEEKEDYSSHIFKEPEVVPYVPKFMQEQEEVTGSARGSAFHKVMELFDFSKLAEDVPEGLVQQEMNRMLESGKLSKEYKSAVSPAKINTFLKSDLAKRMAKAEKQNLLYKEQPFVYGISAKRLNFPAEETVLIQGIIDIFFEEDSELVLADYKTDVIDRPEELIERYKTQLLYYQEALEKITGKRVKEKILYSFYLGCEIIV